jgi:Rieske Fe-S protein
MKFFNNGIAIIMLVLFSGILVKSCETNRGELIPYVTVNIPLLLYADLANLGVGETLLIDGGVNGIVLYREADLEFNAYDRTCTLYPEHNEAVVEDSTFFGVFECPDCQSTYLLMNGAAPNSGPARYPLVEYRASLQGDVLLISN